MHGQQAIAAGSMPRNIEMRRLIDRSLGLEMSRLGFARERRNMYCLQRAGRMSGVVTFTTALFKDLEWQYSPNVGVRHEEINRLLYEVSDDLSDDERSFNLLVAHIITNIGYLMPQKAFRSWSFPLEMPPDRMLEDIALNIKTYGIPFIDECADPEMFKRTLMDATYTLANDDQYLPALFVVEEEHNLAEAFLNDALRKRSTRFDPEARWYRNFAMKLQSIIDSRTNISTKDVGHDQQ